jgi:hypothetical protein
MNRLCLMLIVLVLATGVSQADWIFRDVSNEYFTTQVLEAKAVAWGDVDNDGDPDLFVGGSASTRGVLYENTDGRLTDRTLEYGLANLNTFNAYGAQFVDFDQDGYLDLFVLTDDGHGFNLLRQLPNHRFQTMTSTLNFAFNDPIASVNWFDADNDNTLDLVLSNGINFMSSPVIISPEGQELVENRDEGFLRNTRGAGAIVVEDFDQDGDADIFIGSNGETNEAAQLFCKTPNGYVNYAAGFDLPPHTGMSGAVWFDYNNDQQLDLFSIGDGEQTCLMRGKEIFNMHGLMRTECPELVTAARNARSVHAVDFDMDGWTDLVFVNVEYPSWTLMKNDHGKNWIDVTADAGFDNPFRVSSCAWADWDGDGDMDVVAAYGEIGVRLYTNRSENRHEYIQLYLLSSATHMPLRNCTAWMQFETAKAVGSTYLRTASMGGDALNILLVNGSDYKSGDARLHVNWPNGTHSVYTLDDVTLNSTNYLSEPDAEPAPMAAAAAGPVRLTISPNPFNPTTKLSYTLPEAADVSLQVFNLMGQEVATLVSGQQAAGTHQITFDAAELPTGLYLSRLTANGESHISRLLLTK